MSTTPPAPPLPDASRFTLDGSAALEGRLHALCEEVRHRLAALLPASRLEAILLGGGYGRGEGGVRRTPAGDRPYNDLEFYVCLRGPARLNEWRHGRALHELAESLALAAGVEVEFKIILLRRLRREPVSMFSYDLVVGHRWVWGDESLLAGCEHHRDAALIPEAEATRLLMNRCTGLLFARERLQGLRLTDDDADFIGRNLAKARLALGDAVLTVLGQYHWSCREREARLARLTGGPGHPWLESVRRQHAAGVAFKLHPEPAPGRSRTSLEADLAALIALSRTVWLWLENRRLNRRFDSIADYALTDVDKLPGLPAWRNRLIQARTSGWRGLLRCRYPREQLFNALALLLWEPAGGQPRLTRHIQEQLGTPASGPSGLLDAYRQLWVQFR